MALQENNPGQIEQLRAPKIAMPKSDQELWEHSFLSKCRERLNNHVPKFRGPRLDNWDLWKEDWRTAIETSMWMVRNGSCPLRRPCREKEPSRANILPRQVAV